MQRWAVASLVVCKHLLSVAFLRAKLLLDGLPKALRGASSLLHNRGPIPYGSLGRDGLSVRVFAHNVALRVFLCDRLARMIESSDLYLVLCLRVALDNLLKLCVLVMHWVSLHS